MLRVATKRGTTVSEILGCLIISLWALFQEPVQKKTSTASDKPARKLHRRKKDTSTVQIYKSIGRFSHPAVCMETLSNVSLTQKISSHDTVVPA